MSYYTYEWRRDDGQKMLSCEALLSFPISLRNIDIHVAFKEHQLNYLNIMIPTPPNGPFLADERSGPGFFLRTPPENDEVAPIGVYQMSDSQIQARRAILDEVRSTTGKNFYSIPLKKKVRPELPTYHIEIYEDLTRANLPAQYVWVLHINLEFE